MDVCTTNLIQNLNNSFSEFENKENITLSEKQKLLIINLVLSGKRLDEMQKIVRGEILEDK